MKIIFVRHGHPNYEKNCLTELGHLHAAAAAERLQDSGIQAVYSSPFGRAVETAEYTAKRLGLPVIQLDFMRELIWGDPGKAPYDGGHPWSTADRMVQNGDDLLRADWRENSLFKGNQLIEDTARLDLALDAWLQTMGYTREGNAYRVGENTNRTIALFSHGGSSAAALGHLLRLPFPFAIHTFRPDYTGIIELEFSDEPGTLTVPKLGLMHDAKHIDHLRTQTVFGN